MKGKQTLTVCTVHCSLFFQVAKFDFLQNEGKVLHRCTECGYSYKKLNEKHPRAHNGEMPFSCRHWNSSFTPARTLKSCDFSCTTREVWRHTCSSILLKRKVSVSRATFLANKLVLWHTTCFRLKVSSNVTTQYSAKQSAGDLWRRINKHFPEPK